MTVENDWAAPIKRLMADNGIIEHHWIDVAQIHIDPEVRKLCAQNACGHYGRNHMCPPGVKDIAEWEMTIRSFTRGLLVSKAYPTQDSFDLEAMTAGAVDFDKTLRRIKAVCQESWPEKRFLLLGAGPCRHCKPCAYVDGEPCRFPDQAYPSVEACGINVVNLARSVGARYSNGKNTVTYFGMILFR